jgi:hypothetical protein
LLLPRLCRLRSRRRQCRIGAQGITLEFDQDVTASRSGGLGQDMAGRDRRHRLSSSLIHRVTKHLRRKRKSPPPRHRGNFMDAGPLFPIRPNPSI